MGVKSAIGDCLLPLSLQLMSSLLSLWSEETFYEGIRNMIPQSSQQDYALS